MASIVENKKYGEGHEVVLKDASKLSATIKRKISQFGYTPGKSKFKLTFNPKKVDKSIVISTDKTAKTIYLKDTNNKILELVASKSAIENSFNHTTSGKTKSNTNLLTEIKENISMWIFEAHFENNKILTEEDITSKLEKNADSYDTTYYQSALKQLDELKKYIKKGGYTYERQGDNLTKELYKNARKLTGKLNDNWNPADVWMIRKNFDLSSIYDTNTSDDLNTRLAEAFYNRDVIPISLKNVTTPKAKSSVVDANKLLKSKLDIDLKFDQIDLSAPSFGNFILKTKSGFAVRAGFKASSTTLSVALEGRMLGAGYQLGAIDAKAYRERIKEKYQYTLRSGKSTPSDLKIALQEAKEIFDKYKRISHSVNSYEELEKIVLESEEFIQNRFSNIISYVYSSLYLPRNDFEEHMKYCYYNAKKITKESGIYLILQ